MAAREEKTKRRARNAVMRQHLFRIEDEDPLSSVANLFDVSMMFAIAALILAMFGASSVAGIIGSKDDVTIVKNPGSADMEIIKKKGVKLEKYKMSKEEADGAGERLGICYRLPDGEVVYVPEAK
ncbi:MAG TPA: DUF2149 domain-containing protein [Candidatus Wallbacteria bacterium]|nr:DUF2149 domain-containing protein [Candidatus Wallbacteria bacterium]